MSITKHDGYSKGDQIIAYKTKGAFLLFNSLKSRLKKHFSMIIF